MAEVASQPVARRTSLQRFLAALGEWPAVNLAAAGIVLFFFAMALFGPAVAPYSAVKQYPADRLQPPSAKHWLGTDELGRDILSRILVGSRDIFSLSGSGALLAVVSGLTIGLFSGYRGGLFDEILMRLLDALLAFPALLLAMLLISTVGTSRLNLVLAVGVLYTPSVARVARSVTLDLKTREFIEACKLRGESTAYIVFREILPGTLGPLAVEGCVRFSYAIFLVASLGFLGLGVQPPAPDWGLMVSQGRNWLSSAPWIVLYPALAISILVVSMNLLSDNIGRILRAESIRR